MWFQYLQIVAIKEAANRIVNVCLSHESRNLYSLTNSAVIRMSVSNEEKNNMKIFNIFHCQMQDARWLLFLLFVFQCWWRYFDAKLARLLPMQLQLKLAIISYFYSIYKKVICDENHEHLPRKKKKSTEEFIFHVCSDQQFYKHEYSVFTCLKII